MAPDFAIAPPARVVMPKSPALERLFRILLNHTGLNLSHIPLKSGIRVLLKQRGDRLSCFSLPSAWLSLFDLTELRSPKPILVNDRYCSFSN
jgi:hypothetical protein